VDSAAQPVVTFTRVDPSVQTDDLYTFTVTTPAEPGTFPLPTVQSYASGTAVQWIGAEGSDEPAPVLVTTAGGAAVPAAEGAEGHHEGHGGEDHGEAPVGGAQTGAGGAAGSGVISTVVLLGIACAAVVGGVAVMPRRLRRRRG